MILVTGGTGLVGAHLLLHLIENGENTIRAIYRKKSQIEKTKSLFDYYSKSDLFEKINWVEADILDIPALEKAFQNIENVYHCAAKISFNPKEENQLRKVNIEGTANVVNLCLDFKVKKLCHVSSIAALGSVAENALIENKIITEENDWNKEIAHSDYAISKYGAEMEVWRGFQEGLPVVIVNPGIIIGAYPKNWNKKEGSGALFTSIKKGFPFYTKGTSGYVAVSDVVKIMHQLMKSTICGERFTVIAENKSYKEVIFYIAEKLNVKKPSFEAKPWMLSSAWKLDWIVSLLFRTKRKISKTSAESLTNTDRISNEKIINALNFEFKSVNKSIDEVIDCFK